MIVLYKKENNQFTASFEDSQGFKTHFGPYPIKLSMILCVHEHFKYSKKEKPIIIEQPWESLMINGIDYGKKLYDVAKRLRREVYMLSIQEYMDAWKNCGLILYNPMDDSQIIKKYD
jgi:hypothetical protein